MLMLNAERFFQINWSNLNATQQIHFLWINDRIALKFYIFYMNENQLFCGFDDKRIVFVFFREIEEKNQNSLGGPQLRKINLCMSWTESFLKHNYFFRKLKLSTIGILKIVAIRKYFHLVKLTILKFWAVTFLNFLFQNYPAARSCYLTISALIDFWTEVRMVKSHPFL